MTSNKAKLLIVEDEQPLRELLHSELQRNGYQVRTAADGREGMRQYTEEIFNVVLLDIKLPEIDGVSVLKLMKQETNIPEIIVFTGHGDIETAVQCVKLGAYDYLTKPVKLDELEMIIDKAHDKNRLRQENINLKLIVDDLADHRIVGQSKVIKDVLETVARWGPTDEHVLIFGESGTGKELVARAVHDASPRVGKPFVTINCGRLDASTAESELFGHMQGAFTSANKTRAGLFELADTGTLFMDEISEMPLDVQVKMLRVLETGVFRRMGGSRDINVDVRFVFASNKNLQQAVELGTFREDLYHRINLLPIDLPPLRERRDDIIPLAFHMLRSCRNFNYEDWDIAPDARNALRAYDWPGNIRELKNYIRRACILATEPVISCKLLRLDPPSHPRPGIRSDETDGDQAELLPLWIMERDHIQRAMSAYGGNKSKVARTLEIDRKTLYAKLERYNLLP